MSGFFERPAPAPRETGTRPPRPAWQGSPDGALPATVAAELLVARNDRAVVFVGRCAVYPEGFEFDVRVLAADDEVGLDPSLNGVYLRPGTGPEGTYPTMLRFGVEFADGRKATNVGQDSRCEGEPQSPVLWGQGGGGSGSSWRQTFWMWPLPPPGPLSFVCEWPAAGIPLSRAQIDGESIIDAAARAQTIFPDQVGREPSLGWSSSSVQIVSSSDRAPDPEA